MPAFHAEPVPLSVRLWQHVGLLTVVMGAQIVGLLVAGIALQAVFLSFAAVFLTLGLIANLVPMSSRAWAHLLDADVGPQEVRLRYLLGDTRHEKALPRSEVSATIGVVWGRGARRRKLHVHHNGTRLFTQCAGKQWSNELLQSLCDALEA